MPELDPAGQRRTTKPDGLLVAEARRPLRINGMKAADFIRRAYDLGDDCNGRGRFDMRDPIQTELRHIEGWIKMAQTDALDAMTSRARTRTDSEEASHGE